MSESSSITWAPAGGEAAGAPQPEETSPVEVELRRTKDRLAEAQRVGGIGSFEWEPATGILSWSDQLFRLYGLEPGAVEPNYEEFISRIHPDDRAAVQDQIQRALVDCRAFENTKRGLYPDGEIFLMHTRAEVITDEDGDAARIVGICKDVTAERAAEEASARFASIFFSTDDAIATRNLKGTITSWNPASERLYGYTEREAVGEDVYMLIPTELVSGDQEVIERLVGGERVEHFETRRVRKDGTTIDVSMTMSPILGPNGELIGFSTISRDITERKRIEERLTQLANHDPLTGLYNRHRFEEELILQVAKMRRYGTGGAVLVLDLDNFKYVNDGFGHGAGDDVLRSLGRLLDGRLRESDVLARIGGDEFAILMPDTDETNARKLAMELLAHVREHHLQIDGRPVRVTTSIGVTLIDDATTNAEELLAEADRAMYDAKDSGRDRVITLERGDRGATRRPPKLTWEHRIRDALEQDSLVLYCQPILDLRTEKISQHELLLRIRGDDGLVPPGAFLGDAERLGLIHEIDRWVVTEAIRLLGEQPSLRLEVNLSGSSVDDEGLLKLIERELDANGADPSRLIFEITETAAIASMDQGRRFAEALREVGCRFALDDFGAGFGSFYYLKHIPVDFLKIDGDFVRSPRSRTDELVVESIVTMAKGLGKETIAEFVEDADTLDAIRSAGVDFAQGFHIGRPVPLSELAGD
jgi:diguanylate cyclase (GGDEF)-like protein/PAS domain S-box-containing protein